MKLRMVLAASLVALLLTPIRASAATITGPIDSSDFFDLWQFVYGGGSFVASTDNPGTTTDTELFLFDHLLTPIAYNDDISGSNTSSMISTSLGSGMYYIAASGWPMVPAGFFDSSTFNGSWLGNPGNVTSGDYNLTLSDVDQDTVHKVVNPEPATLTLFGTGLFGLVSAARRRKKLSAQRKLSAQ